MGCDRRLWADYEMQGQFAALNFLFITKTEADTVYWALGKFKTYIVDRAESL